MDWWFWWFVVPTIYFAFGWRLAVIPAARQTFRRLMEKHKRSILDWNSASPSWRLYMDKPKNWDGVSVRRQALLANSAWVLAWPIYLFFRIGASNPYKSIPLSEAELQWQATEQEAKANEAERRLREAERELENTIARLHKPELLTGKIVERDYKK